MSSEELRMKFTECACQALSRDSVAQVTDLIDRLEDLDRLDPLFELLIGTLS